MKPSKGERIFAIFNYALLIFICVITLYPMLYVLFASVSDPTRLAKHLGPLFAPLGLSVKAYVSVLKTPSILSGYGNTLFVVIVGTAINVLLSVICGYALSRRGLYIKKLLMIMVTVTMFFSGGLIPLYLTVRKLHLFNSLWALILPVAISTFNMIIVRTYFQGIPESLEESAKVDGANDITILFRIFIPMAMPAIAVITLYYAVTHWNSWFNAMCFLNDRGKYPLQLILREILILNSMDNVSTGAQGLGEADVAVSIKYATVIVATLPILCVYPFLQKYFVKGMTVGAVKG